ncbi:MAG: SLC13 family permease [Candidatus Merdivicinus sp.]|jgi:Na+/H+ antiporter NhaD/arsenite permease-like protein
MGKRILRFVKSEPVLVISGILAILSMFAVPPSSNYLGYIDFRTLGILFCLMAAVAGLTGAGLFDAIARMLSARAGNLQKLCFLLIIACFLLSMFITNDVALITFVPLTLLLLGNTVSERVRIFTIVLETIAANLGSALTPFGNPQNLYLYSRYGMGIGEFLAVTVPVCVGGLVLIAAGFWLSRIPKQPVRMESGEAVFSKRQTYFFGAMFLLSLLAVFRVIPWYAVLAIIVVALAAVARPIFRRIDYSLLLTFIFFFILVGNLGNIAAVEAIVSSLLEGRELLVSAIVSQFISNVPAALMLSGFTDDWQGLLAGTNIGGLGTLIASMASLISFRLYARSPGAKSGKYFLVFTGFNFVFLVIMLGGTLL